MSWVTLLVLAAGCYGFKVLGLVGLTRFRPPPWFQRLTTLLPPALLAALVVVQTFGDGRALTLDARAAGLAAGCAAVALRAPFIVVVIAAAAVTALLRAAT